VGDFLDLMMTLRETEAIAIPARHADLHLLLANPVGAGTLARPRRPLRWTRSRPALTAPRQRVAVVTGTSPALAATRDAPGGDGLDGGRDGARNRRRRARGRRTARLDLRARMRLRRSAARSTSAQAADALVCNAGYFQAGAGEISSQKLREQLEVNLVGTLALCVSCCRAAKGAPRGVLVSSISAGSARRVRAYCASKWGWRSRRGAGRELEPDGVRVVIVERELFAGTEIGGKSRMRPRPIPRGTIAGARGLREFLDTTEEEGAAPEIAVDAIVRATGVGALHYVGDDAFAGCARGRRRPRPARRAERFLA